MEIHMQKIICFTVLLLLSGPGWARDTSQIMSEVLVQSGESWDGSPLPAYTQGQPEVSVVKITIPPGVALPMHKHPYMNAGVLLSGELTVRTENGQIRHLRAGEALIEVVNTWHYGANEGDVPAEILVVYAGEAGMPFTVLQKQAESE